MLAVPRSLAEITPQWLAEALQLAGVLPGGTVAAASVEPIGADRGYTGVLARVRPRYADAPASAPASLVVKLPTGEQPSTSAYRRVADADPEAARLHYQRCAREVDYYRDLAAHGARSPVCHLAVSDPDRAQVVLLLADVAGHAGDKLAGCSAVRARSVLDAVVPLHAAMWRRPGPDWLTPFVRDPEAHARRYESRVAPFLRRYGHQLPPAVRDLLRGLGRRYAAALAELAAAPQTVIHGEPHLDNVMFVDSPGGEPATVLLDWQSVRYGPAAYDIAEVVFGSLSVQERRAHEHDLLAYYAAALADRGVPDYPTDRLAHHCALALLCHAAGLVGWLAVADPGQASPRERALFEAAFGDGRLVAALADHGMA